MSKKRIAEIKETKEEKEDGYPVYPISEDIYNRSQETDTDPEDLNEVKKPIKGNITSKNNEMDFKDDETGGDLDVPGSELDDKQEDTGSEDEENNSYSIGGDNHNNLEEEKE
ncbi:MAG: hypothetical protein NTW29_08265 [Bacteroidetes bacterium]|nr:hypothetical protein [Bacteroidota bacterium]